MSSVGSVVLILYAFSVLAVLVTRFVNGNVGTIFGYLCACISFTVAALRPESFPDVDSYQTMYEFASTGEFGNPLYWLSHGEPGFKILAYFLSFLGLSYIGFLGFFAGLSCLLLHTISRISKISFVYIWFCYFSVFFITRDMGVIRLSIASHLVVIFFLSSHRRIGYLSIAISSLFLQYFSFVVLLIKFMARFKIEWRSLVILFLVSLGLSNFIDFEFLELFIPEKQAKGYAGTNHVQAGNIGVLLPIFRNFIFAAAILYLLRAERASRDYRIWIWAALLSVAVYIMASGVLIVAQRFSAYFGAIVPIALAYVLSRETRTYGNFSIVMAICCANFGAAFFFNDFIWRL